MRTEHDEIRFSGRPVSRAGKEYEPANKKAAQGCAAFSGGGDRT